MLDKCAYNAYNNKCEVGRMKQKDFLKRFFNNGWWVLREGRNHIIMTNGYDIEAVPRHKEINEQLAKAIIKRRGLK